MNEGRNKAAMDLNSFEKVFHGTSKRIEVYEISLSLNSLPCDFGNGFYTTPSQQEAAQWAMLKDPIQIVINEYELNFELIQDLRVKVFADPDLEWFDFIKVCRETNERPADFDIIIGPVATIFDYDLFDVDRAVACAKLKDSIGDKRATQVVFCTNEAIKTLKLVRDIPIAIFEEASYE
jgi:hypothetical protein